MYYTIYKITNKKTGEIYIGQHVTSDLDDSYMGSGVRILNAIAKYGRENFIKEILYVFDNFEEMDQEEAELVNEEFIKRSDTYNITLGGTGWCTKGTVTVEDLTNPGTFIRIHINQFNSAIHKYTTSGSIQVYLKTTGEKIRVSTEEYWSNKSLYNAISTDRVSVRHKESNETMSIPISQFDETIHEKVFGGIVVLKDGKRRYVSKEEFISENMSGIHKNKVTVMDLETGVRKHVTCEEYQSNKNRYKTFGSGTVTVKDILTGKRFRIPVESIDKTRHIVGTSGWATVYDINLGKFVNIPKGTLDRTKYKLSSDKKIICYNADGSHKFEFWGSKGEFLQTYKCPASVWDTAIKNGVFRSDRKNSQEFNGCRFELVSWKPQR